MAAPTTGLRTYVILWCGQFVSLAGSSLSGFALGVYAYLLTGSVTTLGVIYALAYLPQILASPFTGSLVDRWGPRRALVVSNVAAAAVMLALAALLATDRFAIWHIYPIVVCLSVIGALQTPSFEAAVPLLVPKRHIGRANGLRMVALATTQVLAPIGGGYLLLAIDISGIILLDCVSFTLALITLAAVRIPRPAGSATTPAHPLSLLREFAEAWRWVAARHGLVALMVFLGALNFCAGFVDVLIIPLVLAFAAPNVLGTVMSIGGLGMIGASVAMSIWGGPRRRVHGVLGFSLILGVATVIGALRPSIPLITIGAVLFLGSLAIVMGSNQAIWQTKVEPQLLGRTMALLGMVANTPQLIAYLVAGPAVDHVFEPLVGSEAVRSPFVAALVGDGPGRGIALLLMLMGVLTVGCAIAGIAYPRLRNLDDELPDASTKESPMPVEPVPASAAVAEVTP
ncbi:MFS transporter [Micromonospora profundi]|uniref:MFS transporter n=1 Tax=Micromonospora TaxID=1873 RepID=UPI0033B19C1C